MDGSKEVYILDVAGWNNSYAGSFELRIVTRFQAKQDQTQGDLESVVYGDRFKSRYPS